MPVEVGRLRFDVEIGFLMILAGKLYRRVECDAAAAPFCGARAGGGSRSQTEAHSGRGLGVLADGMKLHFPARSLQRTVVTREVVTTKDIEE